MDARVNEGNPTNNYGTDAVLRVVLTSGGSYQTFLRFDLTSLGAAPASARLRLFVTDPSNVGGVVFATSGSWTETGITWANKPAPVGSQVASAGAVLAGTWVEFDVTSAVTAPAVVNFLVTSTSTNSAYFSSREGANPPELVVETQ
jgi:hypothetical protein